MSNKENKPPKQCGNCSKAATAICNACKSIAYCDRECQLAHRKAHRKECKEIKLHLAMEGLAVGDSSHKACLLDIDLVPTDLWKSALSLVKKGDFPGASWNFLLALYLDFSLDGNDMMPACKAVSGCAEDDPVALALSIATYHTLPGQYVAERFYAFADGICKRLDSVRNDSAAEGPCADKSLDEIDRANFAAGVAKIFYARVLGRYHNANTPMKAQDPIFKAAWLKTCKMIDGARSNIDPEQWLTMQYELGYSNFDVGATRQAKSWLTKLLDNVQKEKTKRGTLNKHWLRIKSSAEQKLQILPLFEEAMRSGLV